MVLFTFLVVSIFTAHGLESADKDQNLKLNALCKKTIEKNFEESKKYNNLSSLIHKCFKNNTDPIAAYAANETFNGLMIETILQTHATTGRIYNHDLQFVTIATELETAGALQVLQKKINENKNIKENAGNLLLEYW